jgi:hypothetical protein
VTKEIPGDGIAGAGCLTDNWAPRAGERLLFILPSSLLNVASAVVRNNRNPPSQTLAGFPHVPSGQMFKFRSMPALNRKVDIKDLFLIQTRQLIGRELLKLRLMLSPSRLKTQSSQYLS